jgi:hypothetical protein
MVVLGAFVMTGVFIHAYAVNTLYYDQLVDANLVEHLRNGTLSLSLLWGQHNENRIFFPNLITLALAETVHLNIVVEVVISTVFWWASAAVLVFAHHRRAPFLGWPWYIPVIAGFGSLLTQSDLLFGFRMSWFLTMLCLSAVLMVLDRDELHRPTTALAVALAVVGSFSALQGLLIWPAGLVLLVLRRRSRTTLIVWIASACATTVVYFYHYNFTEAGVGAGTGPSGPKGVVRFFFTSIGNLFGTPFATPKSENNTVLVIGIVVFASAVVAVAHGVRHPRGAAPLGVALIAFGLLFEASSAIGRARLGLGDEGRYCIFTLTIWVGTYLTLIEAFVHGRIRNGVARDPDQDGISSARPSPVPSSRVVHPVTTLALFCCMALLLLQFFDTWSTGIIYGQYWKTQRLEGNQVAVRVNDAPSPLIAQLLGGYEPSFTKQLLAEAKQERLSLFATSAATADAAAGFVLMVVPAPESVISGRSILDVAVTDPPLKGPVSFFAEPSGGPARMIAVATDSGYGWYTQWNTRTVPNGPCSIWATATNPGGSTKVGPSILVYVQNIVPAASSPHPP